MSPAVDRVKYALAHPGAVKDKLTGRRPGKGKKSAKRSASRPPKPGHCLVCGSANRRVQVVHTRGRDYEIHVCQSCKYVSNPGNTVDYSAFTSVTKFALTGRVGTEERTGREFAMATMGADILGRKNLSAMVFGAGRSQDYKHIGRLPSVRRVVMSDVVDLIDDPDYFNITKGTDERFDLIIACEVVEHFTDPAREFAQLFDLLTPKGLLICSTNIYPGGDVAKQTYLYLRGHTSYYGPPAIARIARDNGMRFDFRMPRYGRPDAAFGKNKRYVIFTKSARNLEKVAIHFGRHPYAPAEVPLDKAPPAKRRQAS